MATSCWETCLCGTFPWFQFKNFKFRFNPVRKYGRHSRVSQKCIAPLGKRHVNYESPWNKACGLSDSRKKNYFDRKGAFCIWLNYPRSKSYRQRLKDANCFTNIVLHEHCNLMVFFLFSLGLTSAGLQVQRFLSRDRHTSWRHQGIFEPSHETGWTRRTWSVIWWIK